MKNKFNFFTSKGLFSHDLKPWVSSKKSDSGCFIKSQPCKPLYFNKSKLRGFAK